MFICYYRCYICGCMLINKPDKTLKASENHMVVQYW